MDKMKHIDLEGYKSVQSLSMVKTLNLYQNQFWPKSLIAISAGTQPIWLSAVARVPHDAQFFSPDSMWQTGVALACPPWPQSLLSWLWNLLGSPYATKLSRYM